MLEHQPQPECLQYGFAPFAQRRTRIAYLARTLKGSPFRNHRSPATDVGDTATIKLVGAALLTPSKQVHDSTTSFLRFATMGHRSSCQTTHEQFSILLTSFILLTSIAFEGPKCKCKYCSASAMGVPPSYQTHLSQPSDFVLLALFQHPTLLANHTDCVLGWYRPNAGRPVNILVLNIWTLQRNYLPAKRVHFISFIHACIHSSTLPRYLSH